MKTFLTELKSLRRKADGDFYTPDIRAIARRIGMDHDRALALWKTGEKAARILALETVDPARVTEKLLDRWVRDIDSWDLCDGFTAQLVRPQSFAVRKAHEWAEREGLYERRAGFSLIAQIAWQENEHPDKVFTDFLPVIERHAGDDRDHVKKAVNWALRDIGKRNPALGKKARAVAARLKKSDDKTARWVGTHRMAEIGI